MITSVPPPPRRVQDELVADDNGPKHVVGVDDDKTGLFENNGDIVAMATSHNAPRSALEPWNRLEPGWRQAHHI
ncbi:hypothetical protein EIP91_003362 [Steccherinum ochraceum]|uniref:Uncharacterized protein n=1 Tax=Steccherinum ochraceum TaxID=92696 RepID=A0A4R0RGZ4_9APHY|nr:hypothetical protein EIP91_003362 [Steccherinum ochraceum]